jgi:hypothetical protein
MGITLNLKDHMGIARSNRFGSVAWIKAVGMLFSKSWVHPVAAIADEID